MFKKRAAAIFIPGWSLGLIDKTILGRDGAIREVIVKYCTIRKGEAQSNAGNDDLFEEIVTKSNGVNVKRTNRQADELILLHGIEESEDNFYVTVNMVYKTIAENSPGFIKTKMDKLLRIPPANPLAALHLTNPSTSVDQEAAEASQVMEIVNQSSAAINQERIKALLTDTVPALSVSVTPSKMTSVTPNQCCCCEQHHVLSGHENLE